MPPIVPNWKQGTASSVCRVDAIDIIETAADDCFVLRIYRASSGQWTGKLLVGGKEIGGIAGCKSAEDVEQVAYDNGILPDRIELDTES